MEIYPAIDIKGGRVVRSLEGDREHETEYGSDPVEQAAAFVTGGARWLHVVDMDRAFRTGGDNAALIRRITGLDGARVQLGGNVGTMAWAETAAETGASRIVLGTEAALDEGGFMRLLGVVGPDRCGLAVDVRAGRIAIRGRPGTVSDTVSDLVRRALDCGVRTIVYRDIGRDGLLAGADVEGAVRVMDLGAEVIVAGGVAGLDELRAAAQAGLAGVIVGRALYEGRFTLSDAVACSR